MKRIVVVLVLLFLTSLFAKSTIQVEIKESGKWQLIGVVGLHDGSNEGSSSSGSSDGDTWGDISGVSEKDIYDEVDSDGNTTWYNFTDNGSAGDAVVTTDDNASLGIYIIEGEKLPNGNAASTTSPDKVYVKGSFRVFNETTPKNSMYIKSTDSDNPVIKITYQTNMEGTKIYLKFDNNNDDDYYTDIELDSIYTYDNALVLEGKEKKNSTLTSSATTTNLKSKIVDTYDENLSDNNRSMFANDRFEFSSGITTKYDDTNITVYSYQDGNWKLYNSTNSDTSKNDFNSFSIGSGYWVKVDKSKSDPSGFVFANGDITDSTWASYYGSLADGWNLLAFNDGELLKAPTGVFVKLSSISGSGLTIKDAYGSSSFELISNACDTEKNASAYINFKVMQSEEKGLANYDLRAYPAVRVSDAATGIVIVSSRRFEVNASSASTIKSLSGEELKFDDATDYYFPKYGEYILAVKPNSAIFNLDAPIYVTLQNLKTSKKVDLSNKDLSGFAAELNSSLSAISSKYSQAYMIDTNWDDENETIVMVADTRFGIKERSYYKLFKQVDDSGTAYIEGKKTGANAPTITVSSTFATTVSNINDTFSDSQVKAFATNNSKKILLLISEYATLDIKEETSKNCFTDLPISSSEDGNDTKKGAINEVYEGDNLVSLKVKYDNNDTYSYSEGTGQQKSSLTTLSPNLNYQTVWMKSFGVNDNVLQKLATISAKQIVRITTGIKTDNGIRWKSLDATKPVDTWFGDYDYQEILWTEKERGYWVYLRPYTAATITQTLSKTTEVLRTTHFDNNISTTDGTSTTKNYLIKDLEIVVEGAGTLEYTYASINGVSYQLISDGSSKTLRLDTYQMGIEQSSADKAVALYSYDGFGASAIDTEFATVGIVQPSAPQLSWDTSTGDLLIANTDFESWDIHENNISDIEYSNSVKAKDLTAGNYALSKLKMDPSWSKITDTKPYFDMKVVTKGSNGFYSDVQAFKYAPVLEEVHILEEASGTAYDDEPKSYITDSNAPTLDGDSGVVLKSFTGDIVRMSYQPITNDKNEYLKLGYYGSVPHQMYVSDGTDDVIAEIRFVDGYKGNKFYLYDAKKKKLYYGRFSTSNSNDADPFTLTEITNYKLGSQPIVE